MEKEALKRIYNLAQEIASGTAQERVSKQALEIISITKELAKKIASGPKARPTVEPQDAADSPIVRGASQYQDLNYKNESLKKVLTEVIQKWMKKHGKKK